jgi:NTP pyrophosphatase (non-canonical NTP hydrolase)
MEWMQSTIGEMSLDNVVDAVSVIYAQHDKKRSLWDVWSHALHHSAAVAEEIRKLSVPGANESKIKQELADLALWFFTMMGKLRGSLGSAMVGQPPQDWVVRISVGASDLLWNRYPGICPWCYPKEDRDKLEQFDEEDRWRPCSCDFEVAGLVKKSEELRARALRTREIAMQKGHLRPHSIDDWQKMFRSIFGDRLIQMSISEVGLHLLEEMGEVSDCLIRMYTYGEKHREQIANEIRARQRRLEDELADVQSWLFALIERIHLHFEGLSKAEFPTNPNEDPHDDSLLSRILWAQYGSNEMQTFYCRHCNQAICKCSIYFLQTEQEIEYLQGAISVQRKSNNS